MESASPIEWRSYKLAQHVAHRMLRRRVRTYRLLKRAYFKLSKHPDLFSRIRADLGILIRLARSWSRGDYRSIPWRSMTLAMAAIIYFVNPADFLPDALLGVGLLDDGVVITAVVRAIRTDLNQFLLWEQSFLPPTTLMPMKTAIEIVHQPVYDEELSIVL